MWFPPSWKENPLMSQSIELTTPQIPAEREAKPLPGVLGLLGALTLVVLSVASYIAAATEEQPLFVLVGIVFDLVAVFVLLGLFVVQPGQARVLVLVGRYVGTVKADGWFWANPLAVLSGSTSVSTASTEGKEGKVTVTKKPSPAKISLRLRNLTTPVLKVNDAVGNPIEIGAIIGWRIADTAKARFAVDDIDNFVLLQTETAVRHLGTEYAYDSYDGITHSLRANPDEAAAHLAAELRTRLETAGVILVEARVSHLAYAAEIAEAMLRRQQAAAVVSARRTIVDGAVGMVEDALHKLAALNLVELDDERKAAMVSNLLVVLTSEQQTHPVVNVGTLY
jgi:regulator of protease activity HflC (stomatin/prohibitin superfamily)